MVISFVKKTVAGVASLLRLHKPLISNPNEHRHYKDTQVCGFAIELLFIFLGGRGVNSNKLFKTVLEYFNNFCESKTFTCHDIR